jgi:hypothetical protein
MKYNILKQLLEKWFDTVETGLRSTADVFKFPAKASELKNLFDIRLGSTKNNEIYFWDAQDATHLLISDRIRKPFLHTFGYKLRTDVLLLTNSGKESGKMNAGELEILMKDKKSSLYKAIEEIKKHFPKIKKVEVFDI